ncbi:TniB family NTP-binding protein [Alicyclobacillus curvatus]|nr:TniB family NTP-binding protein [Alicyclobacillus curvatus]
MDQQFEKLNGVPAPLVEVKRRKEHTKKIIVKYNDYRTLQETISNYHEMSKGTVLNDGIFISGETGMGKTTLLREYVKNHPPEVLDDRTRVPVLYVTVPVGSSIKALTSKILEGFGDPLFDKGTELNMLSRIYRYIDVCEVELIIFDEFQHLIDSDTQHVLNKVSNWMKTFIETIERPVILCGMPESVDVFAHNPQLDRRFCHRFPLTGFQFDTRESQREFRSFLKNIDGKLPFVERANLADPEFSSRLFYASLGVPFYIMKILEEATEYAARSGMDQLTMDCFSRAFDTIRRSRRPCVTNPFCDNFNLVEAFDRESKESKNLLSKTKKKRKT